MAGMWFAHAIKSAGLHESFDLLVPVPLHAAKQRRRGYNQCDQIAKGMAEVLEIPWSHNVLTKPKHTQSQTRKSRWERSENVAQGFEVADAAADCRSSRTADRRRDDHRGNAGSGVRRFCWREVHEK